MAQRLQDRPVKRAKQTAQRGSEVVKGMVALYLGVRSLGLGIDTLLYRGFRLVMLVPFVMGLVLFIVGLYLIAGKGKKKREFKGLSRKTREETFTPSRPTAKPSFSFRENDHQHIVPTGLSVERQLEQLETLRGAGLYTREEYLAKKHQILGQK